MDNNFAGVGLIVLGMFFFSIQDILIKLIIVDTSLLQILVFRAVAGCILLIIFLLNSLALIFKVSKSIDNE